MHFNQTKDDVLVLSSYKFLNDISNNEKYFIIVNLSKWYVCIVEVKANLRKFQTVFLIAKINLQKCSVSFHYHLPGKLSNYFMHKKVKCRSSVLKTNVQSMQSLLIRGSADKSRSIEQKIGEVNKDWNPLDHVSEFIELFKQLVLRLLKGIHIHL